MGSEVGTFASYDTNIYGITMENNEKSFARDSKNHIKFNSQLFDKTSETIKETMPAKFAIRTMTNKARRYTNSGADP